MSSELQRASDLPRLVAARLADISAIKSQVEVADEVGYANSNMLSHIKSGKSKLALDRVPAMAKALDLDVEIVLLPALRQYYSEEVIEMLREVFSSAQTQTERDLLVIARRSMDTKQGLSFDTRGIIADALKANKPAGV